MRTVSVRIWSLAASTTPGATDKGFCLRMRRTSGAGQRRRRCALTNRSMVVSRSRTAFAGVGAWFHKSRNQSAAALVQIVVSDRLRWRAELFEVVDGHDEAGSGAVRGSPLRPRSHHPMHTLVSSVQTQSARPRGDDGRARPVDGAYDDHALGAALRPGVRETLAPVCPGGRPVMAGR